MYLLVLLCNTVTHWMPGTIFRNSRQEAPKRCFQGWTGQIFSAGRVEQGETLPSPSHERFCWAVVGGSLPWEMKERRTNGFHFQAIKVKEAEGLDLDTVVPAGQMWPWNLTTSEESWPVVSSCHVSGWGKGRHTLPRPFKHLPSLNKRSEIAK